MIDGAKRFCLGACIGTICYVPFDRLSQLIVNREDTKKLDFSLVDQDVKIQCLYEGILKRPISEEIRYRGILQGTVLPKISQKFMVAPMSKSARVVAVSALFASVHYNKEYALMLGLELGLIKESKLRFLGCVGAHMANNCVGLMISFT